MALSIEELAAEHVMLSATRPVQNQDWEGYAAHMEQISILWKEMVRRFGLEATTAAVNNCETTFELLTPK